MTFVDRFRVRMFLKLIALARKSGEHPRTSEKARVIFVLRITPSGDNVGTHSAVEPVFRDFAPLTARWFGAEQRNDFA
jgi:hypothetical protein